MKEEGFPEDKIKISVSADFRFRGQYYELSVPLPSRPLTNEDAPLLAQQFLELYERTYGSGTAWKNVATQMLNVSLTVTGGREKLNLQTSALNPTEPKDIQRSIRKVYLPDLHLTCEVPIYDDSKFTAGSTIQGPAIIDVTDTTIYVPTGVRAYRDEYMNYVLSHKGGH